MHNSFSKRWIIAIVPLLVFACDEAKTPTAGVPQTQTGGAPMGAMRVESLVFRNNDVIPVECTGDGKDLSPTLMWSGVPAAAKELALIVDDPDAPAGDWVHWVVYKIPATALGLPEGVPAGIKKLAAPMHTLQGKNSWDKIGYGGPAPPKGHGVHHYHFKLFALDKPLDLEAGATKAALLAAMQGHVIGQAEIVGIYQR